MGRWREVECAHAWEEGEGESRMRAERGEGESMEQPKKPGGKNGWGAGPRIPAHIQHTSDIEASMKEHVKRQRGVMILCRPREVMGNMSDMVW
jgi:hypothetical protein